MKKLDIAEVLVFLVILLAVVLVLSVIQVGAQVPVPTSAPSPLATPTKQLEPPYEWCEWQTWNSRLFCDWLYVPIVSNWGSLDDTPRTLSGRLVYGD